MTKPIKILSIETSCDETAAAVLSVELNGKKINSIKTLSAVVKSQIKLHAKMGGVVPETAARAHVKNILPVVNQALSNSHSQLSTINYLAVTQGPGLIPSLIVGVEFAKALSFATGIPLIPINHLSGHLYSALPNSQYPLPSTLFPLISLIVSGGHTMIVLMKDPFNYKIIGQTVDDAAGEAFDKVAKLLKLPYPGGPEVSKLASIGNSEAINFPRPMINSKDFNFSFSGLKTAVLYYVRDNKPISQLSDAKKQKFLKDICASFQQAAIDVLIKKTLRAAKEFKAKSVSLSGGVSANSELRRQLNLACKMLNITDLAAPFSMTGDNAEMIGIAAAMSLAKGTKLKSAKNIYADPGLGL